MAGIEQKESFREAKANSLSAATLAVGSRARWVGPNGWIIEGGSDGRGMPMPGARGGWRLRGADNGWGPSHCVFSLLRKSCAGVAVLQSRIHRDLHCVARGASACIKVTTP